MSGIVITDVDFVGVEKRRFPSKHYVYIIRVARSGGIKYVIFRRYSHFIRFERRLSKIFHSDSDGLSGPESVLPTFCNKIVIGRSHVRRIAESRTAFLEEYCKKLMRMPTTISHSSEIVNFFTATPDDARDATEEGHVISSPTSRQPREIKHISDPVDLDEYRVLSDYTASDKHTIPLVSGTLVDVISKSDIGWWFVKAGDRQGWVPSSYLCNVHGSDEDDVKILSTGKPYICTKSYTSQEWDEMSLVVGMLVKVLEKRMDGWWLIQYDGREAIVPGCCLAPTNSMKARRLMKILPEQNSTSPNPPSRSSLNPVDDDRNLVTVYQDTVHWTRISQSESSDEELPTSPQAIPKRSVKRPTGTSRIAQLINNRVLVKNGNVSQVTPITSEATQNKPLLPIKPSPTVSMQTSGRRNAMKPRRSSASPLLPMPMFGGAIRNQIPANKNFQNVDTKLTRRRSSLEPEQPLPVTGETRTSSGLVAKMVSELSAQQKGLMSQSTNCLSAKCPPPVPRRVK